MADSVLVLWQGSIKKMKSLLCRMGEKAQSFKMLWWSKVPCWQEFVKPSNMNEVMYVSNQEVDCA